jgi:hypothetical protein
MTRAYVDPSETKAWHKLDCKHVVRVCGVAMLPAVHATQQHNRLLLHKLQCSCLLPVKLLSTQLL